MGRFPTCPSLAAQVHVTKRKFQQKIQWKTWIVSFQWQLSTDIDRYRRFSGKPTILWKYCELKSWLWIFQNWEYRSGILRMQINCCLRIAMCRVAITDLNTWIAGSHGFAYSSMRATGNPSAAILLQSKHWIDALTYAHVSAWNAIGDRFLASNFKKILKKKWKSSPDLQDF